MPRHRPRPLKPPQRLLFLISTASGSACVYAAPSTRGIHTLRTHTAGNGDTVSDRSSDAAGNSACPLVYSIPAPPTPLLQQLRTGPGGPLPADQRAVSAVSQLCVAPLGSVPGGGVLRGNAHAPEFSGLPGAAGGEFSGLARAQGGAVVGGMRSATPSVGSAGQLATLGAGTPGANPAGTPGKISGTVGTASGTAGTPGGISGTAGTASGTAGTQFPGLGGYTFCAGREGRLVRWRQRSRPCWTPPPRAHFTHSLTPENAQPTPENAAAALPCGIAQAGVPPASATQGLRWDAELEVVTLQLTHTPARDVGESDGEAAMHGVAARADACSVTGSVGPVASLALAWGEGNSHEGNTEANAAATAAATAPTPAALESKQQQQQQQQSERTSSDGDDAQLVPGAAARRRWGIRDRVLISAERVMGDAETQQAGHTARDRCVTLLSTPVTLHMCTCTHSWLGVPAVHSAWLSVAATATYTYLDLHVSQNCNYFRALQGIERRA